MEDLASTRFCKSCGRNTLHRCHSDVERYQNRRTWECLACESKGKTGRMDKPWSR